MDSRASQHAWTIGMGGLWFPVLSGFWPHGGITKTYGVLKSDGMSERALTFLDKKGVIRIRHLHVHGINTQPDLALVMRALGLINAKR